MTLAELIAADAARVASDPTYEGQFFSLDHFDVVIEALNAGFTAAEAVEYASLATS